MLPFVCWLAVYTLAVYAIGRLVRPWRDRQWFKILFLPGTLLAAGLQRLAAALCLTEPCEMTVFQDRRPAFSLDTTKIPCLAGGFFLLLSHLLLYIVFLIGVTQLEALGTIEAKLLRLPEIAVRQAASGLFLLDLREYLCGMQAFWYESVASPLVPLLVIYVFIGCYAALPLTGRQFRWAFTVLSILGVAAFLAEWMGTKFAFLSRGWWVSHYYFPSWWALFSFYVTLALLTLLLFAAIRITPLAIHAAREPDGDKKKDGSKRSGKKKR